MPQDLLSEGCVGIQEATKFVGLGKTKLYQLMERRELDYVKIGRRRLIPRKALIELLEKNLIASSEGGV